MKNYFEDGIIIPFDKVVLIRNITNKDFIVEVVQVNNYKDIILPSYSFPIEQLDNYKLWLERDSKPENSIPFSISTEAIFDTCESLVNEFKQNPNGCVITEDYQEEGINIRIIISEIENKHLIELEVNDV